MYSENLVRCEVYVAEARGTLLNVDFQTQSLFPVSTTNIQGRQPSFNVVEKLLVSPPCRDVREYNEYQILMLVDGIFRSPMAGLHFY